MFAFTAVPWIMHFRICFFASDHWFNDATQTDFVLYLTFHKLDVAQTCRLQYGIREALKDNKPNYALNMFLFDRQKLVVHGHMYLLVTSALSAHK